MEVFNAELCGIGLTLDVTIEKREALQKRGEKTVAVFSPPQPAIWRTAHLEPGKWLRLEWRNNRRGRTLLAHGITTEVHWVVESAKVKIDYRLRYPHTRTPATHSKLPVDPCATCSP